MVYTIENLQHYFSDEFGDHELCFTCDFHFKEPEELALLNYPIPVHGIQQYMQQKHPRFHAYVCSVRHSLDTWGPQTGLTYEALGEDAQELFYQYTMDYVKQPDWLQSIYDHEMKYRHLKQAAQQNPEEYEKQTNELSLLAEEIKKETKRATEFKSKVMRALREITLELYPELMDVATDQLKAFKSVFVDDVLRIENTVSRFMEKLEVSSGQ